MDVRQDPIGTELPALTVLEVVNGMLYQKHVPVHLEIGMDFHVSHVQLDRRGTQLLYHVHVPLPLIGMDFNVEHVLVQEFGVSNSMTVYVEQETGMEPLVLSALPTIIGMEKRVFLVHQVESGTLSI